MSQPTQTCQLCGRAEPVVPDGLGRLAWIPVGLAPLLPYRGPCAFCGCGDARHRDVDAWADRIKAGDDPDTVAFDFGVPAEWVTVAALASGWRQTDPTRGKGRS